MYPVVKYKDGSRELLFNYGVCVENREEFKHLLSIKNDFTLAKLGIPKYKSIGSLANKKNFSCIEKFVNVPCGMCADCLKERSRQWAIRILKEAEQYDKNYFITLTYDDKHLPKNRMLVHDEISKFNKKLKTYLKDNGYKSDFRFYGVGEYGSNTGRPHYHIIYFNFPELRDLKFYNSTDSGDLLFTSEFLTNTWSKGHVILGSVDVGSASYVARYCDKKRLLNKEQKKDYISKGIVPEYSVMSRRPGIGHNYLEKLIENINNGIYTISFKDNNFSLPKYYSDKIKEMLGEDVLINYVANKTDNQFLKISRDLELSDRIGNIQNYYDGVSQEKLNAKKQRMDL